MTDLVSATEGGDSVAFYEALLRDIVEQISGTKDARTKAALYAQARAARADLTAAQRVTQPSASTPLDELKARRAEHAARLKGQR